MREIPFGNGTMRYTDDGRSYFLHHSPNSTIEIGEKIRTTGLKQTTAGDAIQGHSYAWDARTGLRDAVGNQVSKRGSFRVTPANAIPLENLDELPGPKEFSVYLTAADSGSVYPDLNVPGSAARAIKGEQQVLDKITIPANLSDEDATDLIRKMTRKHGIFEASDKSVRQMIDDSILASKGEEALGTFLESHGEGQIKLHIKNVERQIAEGGRKGIYSGKSTAFPHLVQLGEVVESEGSEAAYAFAKKTFTATTLGLDTSKLSAEVSSKAIGTTQTMIDKAVNVQDMIATSRSSGGILDVAKNASAAVAAGTKNSRTLRALGAAKAVFKTRF